MEKFFTIHHIHYKAMCSIKYDINIEYGVNSLVAEGWLEAKQQILAKRK